MLVKFNPEIRQSPSRFRGLSNALCTRHKNNQTSNSAYRKFFFQTRAFFLYCIVFCFCLFWKPQVNSNFHLWLVIRSPLSISVCANSEFRTVIHCNPLFLHCSLAAGRMQDGRRADAAPTAGRCCCSASADTWSWSACTGATTD